MGDSRATIDIEAYAARYNGRTKVLRLRYIALRNAELELDALRIAIDTAKLDRDTTVYKELVGQAGSRLGPRYALDEEWIANTDAVAAKDVERLRRELDENRQQLNKEVIRAGHNDLGDFFYARGRLSNARREYVTLRDYCMYTSNHIEMCVKIVTVSMESSEFHNVENYVHLAENTPECDKFPLEMSKLRCCAAVAQLAQGRYREAAKRFIDNPVDLSEDAVPTITAMFRDTFSLDDLATYTGICVLATQDRSVLLERVLGAAEFRALLELVPDIREMIQDFCSVRYASCLAHLEKLRTDFMLDPFLGREHHVGDLYKLIRAKALVQYVHPFDSVNLLQMANTFNTNVRNLESELYNLIENVSIPYRIDAQNHALHRVKPDARRAALEAALKVGQSAYDDIEVMMLRMNLYRNKMTISWPQSFSRSSSGPASHVANITSLPDPIQSSPPLSQTGI